MATISIHAAETQLSRLISRAEAGEEIILCRGALPVAQIVAFHARTARRVPGALKGQIEIADDSETTPDDFDEYTA